VNVVILQGTLSRPPTARDLPSGDQMVAFEVTTRPAEGPAETVPVCWLDPPRRALAFVAGAEVVVTGRVRRRFFRAGGATASRTEVVADTVLPAGHSARVATALGRARNAIDPDATA
jgi:single-strand DNA-binding protein